MRQSIRFTVGLLLVAVVAIALSLLEQRYIGLPGGFLSNVLVGLTAVALVNGAFRLVTGDGFWVHSADE